MFTIDLGTITSVCVGVRVLLNIAAIIKGVCRRVLANPCGLPKIVIGRSKVAEWSDF